MGQQGKWVSSTFLVLWQLGHHLLESSALSWTIACQIVAPHPVMLQPLVKAAAANLV